MALRGKAAQRLLRTVVLPALVLPALAVVVLLSGAFAAGPPKRDRYGGVKERVAEPSGYFRVQKVGDRWMLVTPEGNPFWMAGVYVVDFRDGGLAASGAFAARYGGDWERFSTRAVRRLRAWGFNTLGEYSAGHVLPVSTRCNPGGNREQMPFVRILHPAWYSAVNLWGLAPGPVKTLVLGGVDPAIYKGPAGHLPDVFDPNFEAYVRALASDPRLEDAGCPAAQKLDAAELDGAQKAALNGARSILHPSLAETPWLIGTTMDDADHLFGFGPGPEFPGHNRIIHPHIGWIVAVTRPTQSHNHEIGKPFGLTREVEYSDPVVYSKLAWRDFLRAKYGSLENLNRAWGSNYSSWDSDGGWPQGRGLLDESGRNLGIGRDPERLSDAAPRVAADMDEFLERFADRYFSVVAAAIRAATPHHLVLSPSMLNAHRGLSRRPILRAAGRYCDLIQVHQDPDNPALIGVTYQETKRPLLSWVGIAAHSDSAVDTPQDGEVKTQGERGARYQQVVETLFSYRAPDGAYPMVGLDWWEYMDKVDEHVNWGLVTPQDNAYDGGEAVVRRGADRWGYSTGGEARNYGDFLSSVQSANIAAMRKLQAEAKREKKRRK